MKEALPYLSLAFVVASLFLSLWVANRAGSWRNSDELKHIEKRLSDVEGRVSVVEKQLEFEFIHLRKQLDGIAAAVARMEGFFMRPPS